MSGWLGPLVVIAAFAGAAACAGRARPAPKPPSRTAEEPEPESVEWLYATDRFSGGRLAECDAVYEWVAGEEKCSTILCRHGAKLGLDWLKTCSKKRPDRVATVRDRTARLETRAATGSQGCDEEGEALIRDGCKDADHCAEEAQRWATRCGAASATPLVKQMIRLAVERSGGRSFELDTRSCNDWLDELEKAASCEPGFSCEDARPAVKLYRERCQPGDTPPGALAAAFQMAVLAGGGEPPAPIEYDGAPLEASGHLPELADGTGAVLRACGKHVSSVQQYLQALAGCRNNEIQLVRLGKDGSGRPILRFGRVGFTTEEELVRRYPSLAVEGELELRDREALPAFVKAVDEAREAAATDPRAAIAELARAMSEHRRSLARSPKFVAQLAKRDGDLVPLFKALGREKQRAAKPSLRKKVLVPFVLRSVELPLADVTEDGAVSIGASTPAAGIRFDVLPSSVAAYASQLSRARKLARRRKATSRDFEDVAMAIGDAAAKCAASDAVVEKAATALLRCAFFFDRCDDGKIDEEAARLESAMRDSRDSVTRTRLAVSSLDPRARASAERVIREAGCEGAIR